jgi:phospholipase/carboxylesterase
MRMRAWYDILGTDLARPEDEAGLRESFAGVHALLEREVAAGMAAERIVLAGFSQGAAITLGAGLRYGRRLAGLVGLSGYLPLASVLDAERSPANAGTPIFLAHGTQDAIVAVARGQTGRDRLFALGHSVQWQEYPMEHSVCMEEVQALQRWLRQVLA